MGFPAFVFAAGAIVLLPTGAVPGAFRHRQRAWEDHVFHLRIGALGFAPQLSGQPVGTRPRLVALGAEGVAVAVDRGFRVLRHVVRRKAEHLALVAEAGAPVVTALVWVHLVREVHIDVVRVGNHHFIPFVGPVVDAIETAPVQGIPEVDAHARGGERLRALGVFQAVLPGLHSVDAVRLHQLADLLAEVARQVLHVGHLAFFDHRLTHLRLGPRLVFVALIDDAFARLRFRLVGIAGAQANVFRFVAAEVPGLDRLAGFFMHLGDLADHLVDKALGRVQARVQVALAVKELHGGGVGGIGRIHQAEFVGLLLFPGGMQLFIARFHRDHRGAGVRRHVYLRDHFNLARLGIFDDVDIVLTAEEAAVDVRPLAVLRQQAGGFAQIVAALAADFRQLRQTGDLDAPAFVIAQVEVEFVELVGRHLIQQAQHRVLLMKVARHVEENAAILEARRIAGVQRGDLAAAVARH